jgi:hypothetical protein
MATLKTACERFCKVGEADAATQARQNNKMMSMCLANSLSLTVKVQLLTYRNKYIFDGVKDAPLIYKVIMRLATINFHHPDAAGQPAKSECVCSDD